jgi:hypothetical protein
VEAYFKPPSKLMAAPNNGTAFARYRFLQLLWSLDPDIQGDQVKRLRVRAAPGRRFLARTGRLLSLSAVRLQLTGVNAEVDFELVAV